MKTLPAKVKFIIVHKQFHFIYEILSCRKHTRYRIEYGLVKGAPHFGEFAPQTAPK